MRAPLALTLAGVLGVGCGRDGTAPAASVPLAEERPSFDTAVCDVAMDGAGTLEHVDNVLRESGIRHLVKGSKGIATYFVNSADLKRAVSALRSDASTRKLLPDEDAAPTDRK